MVNVRRAGPQDIETLYALGAACVKESPRYRDKGWDEAKVRGLIEQSTKGNGHGWFIAEDSEGIVGMALGFVVEYFFSRERYVSDLVVYVETSHRGSAAAHRLIAALEEWAFAGNINACEVLLGISTGINNEKAGCVYKKLGYTVVSSSLTKANPNHV